MLSKTTTPPTSTISNDTTTTHRMSILASSIPVNLHSSTGGFHPIKLIAP
ncbi:hypothetical protein A2U01_0033594, partial [Trifolium medium]|nr:hypothetical protein [Trifolium medium]